MSAFDQQTINVTLQRPLIVPAWQKVNTAATPVSRRSVNRALCRVQCTQPGTDRVLSQDSQG